MCNYYKFIILKVMASFLITALITIASIVYGYLSDSLPRWYLNEVDEAVIKKFRASHASKFLLPWMYASWHSLKNLVRAVVRKPRKLHSKPVDRDKRVEALTQFVLALSDQQLVTGLAILFVAVGSRCKISIYEFLIVDCLAWFSSTTHLATLDVLRDYFIRNQMVRNIRIVGMVTMVILLSVGIVVLTRYSDDRAAMPLQCAISSVSESMNNIAVILVTMILLQFLIFSYSSRFGHLFDDQRTQNEKSYSNRERLLRQVILLRHPKLNVDAASIRAIIKTVVSERRAEARERLLSKIDFRRVNSAPFYTLIRIGLHGYLDSFLSNIPASLFGLSFGISQLSVARWSNPPSLTEDADKLSFGQIVSLLLLILPVLAAAEIYYGKCNADFYALHCSADHTYLQGRKKGQSMIHLQIVDLDAPHSTS